MFPTLLALAFFGFGDGTDPGLRAILDGRDFSYGLPAKLYDRVAKDLDEDAQWRVFGNLPSPPWRETPYVTAPLPLGQSVFVRKGAAVVNQNCLACHAGVVAGQVVAGLGNLHVDAVSFREEAERLVDQWDRPLKKALLKLLLRPREMRALGGYVDHLKTIVLPSVRHAEARGDNQGPWVVWRLIARMLDPANGFALAPTGATTELEDLLDRELPTVRPNPWWRLKYKKRAFWTTDVSPHSYATFALNLMDPAPDNTETFPARMDRTAEQLDFARRTEPPPFPWPVDKTSARRGWYIFHGEGRCFTCHGEYSERGKLLSYPNRAPLDIGTDPTYASILNKELLPLYQHFGQSPFAPTGEDAVTYPTRVGYAPPPLVGIWAAAPYFHNGSVPTIAEVLDSTSRPKLWAKDTDPRRYDPLRVGVSRYPMDDATYEQWKAEAGDPLSATALRARLVYDTTRPGKSNRGHPFGDALTQLDRDSVIEYLKTL